MKNIQKKFLFAFVATLMLFSLSQLTACTEDDDSEYVSCGSGTCDADNPYSNSYTSNCYETISDCEAATGHDCKNCN